MRCADCGLYECVLRSPLGGCPNGEAVEHTVIFPAPNTNPCNLGNDPWNKGYQPSGIQDPIRATAFDLVDAVERYMRQECLRSELVMKKDKLKALLNESI